MITFDELREKTTPNIIKKMCELAEGFEFIFATTDGIVAFGIINKNKWYSVDNEMFGFLLHRAVEGWNKSKSQAEIIIGNCVCYQHENGLKRKGYYFSEYTSCHLTQREMAIWDCLLNIL